MSVFDPSPSIGQLLNSSKSILNNQLSSLTFKQATQHQPDYLNGLPALILLLIWVSSYIIPLTSTLYFHLRSKWSHSRKLTTLTSEPVGVLSNNSHHAQDSMGSDPVREAERQIIEDEVLKQGGLGVIEYVRRSAKLKANSPILLNQSPPDVHSTWAQKLKAIASACKDWITTLGLIGLAFVSWINYQHATVGQSSNLIWLIAPILLWSSASMMSLLKLGLSIRSNLQNQEHPGHIYISLEKRLIPTYLLFFTIAFYNAWNALMVYSDQADQGDGRRLAALDTANFVILFIVVGIEICTPRPTNLLPPRIEASKADQQALAQSSPPPLEPRSSLLSLAYFAHTDSYLWRHTFKTATQATIPDLRVDDKTAAVLYRWTHDQDDYARLGIKPTLLRSLVWHFRSELLGQQFFAWFNAVGALLPPFFLQQILAFISAKSSGTSQQSNKVALLYAFGLLCTQVFLAFSQAASLFLGRRLSVRMRALFISLIFTKGLRRTDTKYKPAKNADGSTKPDTKKSTGEPGSKDTDDAGRASIGKIANLVSNDAMGISEIGAYLHFLWPESAVQLVLAGVYLYLLLGYSALAGFLCVLVGIPIQSYITSLGARCQKELMKAADRRLSLAGELINNIKVIKFFAWESEFMQKMARLRNAELSVLLKRALIGLAGAAVSFSVPISISICTFYVHTEVMKQPLTAEQAFTALALFNVFRFPLMVMTGMISGLLQSYVAMRRIEDFLKEGETEKYSILSVPVEEEGLPLVGFKNAAFTYDVVSDGPIKTDGPSFQLRGLDFGFPDGELSLITGRVGSGKTTLLLSLLGETNKIHGSAFLPSPVARESGLDPAHRLADTTAYAPQQPWLLSDSIRNNILFGSLMNSKRYDEVIQACALIPDLLTFTDGDLTEIGDKGTVLSGGQKARISLARAVYSPAKVLLLDDILSAVDSHTAQHLFENVLMGKLMKDRTCVFVTHAVDLCLPGAGFVVSLDKGEVLFAGKPSLSKSASLIFHEEEEHKVAKETPAKISPEDPTIEELADSSTPPVMTSTTATTKKTQKLVEDERQATGAVSLAIYKLYFKALGGFFPLLLMLTLFGLSELGNVASSWVLKEWAGAGQPEAHHQAHEWLFTRYIYNPIVTITTLSRQSPELWHWRWPSDQIDTLDASIHMKHFLQLYIAAGLATLFVQLSRQFYFTIRSLKASRQIYERLIYTVVHARVRFFDTVPMGRVLNRFSKDVQSMDRDLADNLMYLISDIVSALAILVIIVAVLPIGFLVAAIAASLIYVLIGSIYLASTREIKRSESTTRSPVISLCTECLQGATSIRAYGDIGRYTQHMFKLIDDYNKPYFMLWMCNRWLSSRIDVTAAFFTFAVIAWMVQSNISAALSGFALSYVVSFNVKTLWVVRWWSINEINMNSLERIHEYLEIDQEPRAGTIPPAAWPSRSGSIEVENLSVCYAPNLPRVLKGVSFTIQPGEKIGICGRTGSGKSTLALSFFRFIEAEEGRIVIDGLDISKLDLGVLRKRLTIIPQESVLFTASIRWNLDPFNEHDDSRIWDALRRVGMAAPLGAVEDVGSVPTSSTCEVRQAEIAWITSLDMAVEDGGRNFSMGQRQLLAIARAILKLQESSILILDESTASLDSESDEKIQKTIRTEMEGATILCIAHRLKTIVDYDKVLVLGAGEVLEFGKPVELLKDEGSAFRQLCVRSGHFEELVEMAKAT